MLSYSEIFNIQKTTLPLSKKELESIKNYLLSQKEKPLTNENIKVMQKIYEPKKAVGGAK